MDTKESALNNKAFNRAERILNKWVGAKGLSQTGKDWLVPALDPFHDTVLPNLQGWPDVQSGLSVVRKVVQTESFAVPPGGGLFAGNWDMVIVQWPWLATRNFGMTAGRKDNTMIGPLGATRPCGGVTVYAVAPGAVFDPIAPSASVINLGDIQLGDPYTAGAGRLIAMGFETHNTTAVLNKQGAVTCGRMMSCPKDADVYQVSLTPANTPQSMSFSQMRAPPASQADLLLLQGSRTWAAEHGCYSVVAFHCTENPAYANDYNCPIITYADSSVNVSNTSNVGMTQLVAGAGALQVCFPSVHLNPVHSSIQWYSGLSNSSTIQLTVACYYESFPNQTQKEILALATPSADFDPLALELYSHAVSRMPPGVPVAENNLGEWFADVIDTVSYGLSFVPLPGCEQVANIGKLVGKGVRAFSTPETTRGVPASSGAAGAGIGNGVPPGKHTSIYAKQKPRKPGAKRKRTQAKNQVLAHGSRGRKGNVQGPLRH